MSDTSYCQNFGTAVAALQEQVLSGTELIQHASVSRTDEEWRTGL